MDDKNRTDSRHPAQSSVVATGFDLKACREGPGGYDSGVLYGMVARFHRLTFGILHGHYQTCASTKGGAVAQRLGEFQKIVPRES